MYSRISEQSAAFSEDPGSASEWNDDCRQARILALSAHVRLMPDISRYSPRDSDLTVKPARCMIVTVRNQGLGHVCEKHAMTKSGARQ